MNFLKSKAKRGLVRDLPMFCLLHPNTSQFFLVLCKTSTVELDLRSEGERAAASGMEIVEFQMVPIWVSECL